MTRYGMAIDTKRCFGCQTCAVACKICNNLPNNVWYNVVHTDGGDVKDSASGEFPNVAMRYLPMACQHCDNPACVEACPTGATAKDPETGVVTQDVDTCIGCKSCIMACPYDGVRTFIEDAPEFYADFSLGDVTAPKHINGAVEKCTYCLPLIQRGEEPACMQLCPGRARYWGDLDDPESEIAKIVSEREYEHLEEGSGTFPNTYYLI